MIFGLFLRMCFLPPKMLRKYSFSAKWVTSSWSKWMSNSAQILWECWQAQCWQPSLRVLEVTLQPLPGSEQLPCRLTAWCEAFGTCAADVCMSSRGAFFLTCALTGCREQHRYLRSLSTCVSTWTCVAAWKPALPGEAEGCLQLCD